MLSLNGMDNFVVSNLGSSWFETPCNCKEQICRSVDNKCQGGAPWLDNTVYDLNMDFVPQRIMCGFEGEYNKSIEISNTDSFHSFSTSFFHPHYGMDL